MALRESDALDKNLYDIKERLIYSQPWAAQEAEIEPFYPRGESRGRPPIGLSRMLRMYLAQQCFRLSDEGMEDALFDGQAIRGFVGFDLSRESAPDATTLLKFRLLFETHGLTRKIFEAINDQTKKGNNWHFGMKAHIGVDAQSGLVHTLVTTAANTSDVSRTHALLHGNGRGVRKASPAGRLGRLQDRLEKLKASIRAKVEHPFHVIKNLFQHHRTLYRGLAKNEAQRFSLFAFASLLAAQRGMLTTHRRAASRGGKI